MSTRAPTPHFRENQPNSLIDIVGEMRVRINIAKDISAGLNIARIYNPPRGNHA
jgi:hypothetical protein